MAELKSTDADLNPTPDPIVPSMTVTTSGNTDPINIRSNIGNNLRIQLNVTATSGTTPTLAVTVQDTVDGGANWNNLTPAFTTATGITRQVINIPAPYGYLIRLNYVVGGTTPSFTFQADGIAR